jgi:hypothetical protein
MKICFARLLLFISLIAVCSFVPPFKTARADDNTYSLKRIYHAGDKDRYHVNIVVQGTYQPEGLLAKPMKVQEELDAVVEEDTKEVRPDGTIILESRIISGVTKSDQGTVKLDTIGKPVVTGWGADGKIIQPTGDPSAAAQIVQMDTLPGIDLKLPHPMKIGDQAPFQLACGFTNDQKITGTIQMVALVDKVGDYKGKAVELKLTGNGMVAAHVGDVYKPDPNHPNQMIPTLVKNEDQSFKLETTTYVDPVTGKTISISGKLTSPKFTNISDVTITYTRQLLTK